MTSETSTVIRVDQSWRADWHVVMAVIVAVMLAYTQGSYSYADDSSKPDSSTEIENVTLTYPCEVIDKETGRGIPNARITVRRWVPSSVANRAFEETKYVTDADGKYVITVPPDQAAEKDLFLGFVIEHDDYTTKKGFGRSLAMIRKNTEQGMTSGFERTELYPAEAVTGVVVSPDGIPLPGIQVKSYSRTESTEASAGGFNDTLTDSEGRYRINLHKVGNGVLWIIPKDFASIEKFLARKRGDLGTIKLSSGVRVTGQVRSAEGQPLAGIAVRIRLGQNREAAVIPVGTNVIRGAISDSEGRFVFDPLAPGEYIVGPSEFLGDPLIQDSADYKVPGAFVDQKVTIKGDDDAKSVAIQGVPFVVLSGRACDSNGEKFKLKQFRISGQLDRVFWTFSVRADQDGTFFVHIPHGLQNTRIDCNGTVDQAERFRLGKGQAPQNKHVDGFFLGSLNDDVEGFEIIFYKSPVVTVSAVDDDQKPVPGLQVIATYPWGRQQIVLRSGLRSDLNITLEADGRYQTTRMLPDEDVTFKLSAPGFEPTSKTIKLAEGETQELVVTMKKALADAPKVEGAK